MTIIVLGHMRVPDGKMAELLPVVSRRVANTLQEAGCEFYNFAIDADNPNLFRIAERWESAEALKAHGKQAHMAELTEAARAAGVTDVSVKAWDGVFWRTLIGD